MKNVYEEGLNVLGKLLSQDRIFAMATAENGKPDVRMVDTYYADGAF